MRYKFTGFTRDQNGRIIDTATCSVYLAGTSTPASIYATAVSVPVIHSVASDANGAWTFYTDILDYPNYQGFDVVVSKTNYTSSTIFVWQPTTALLMTTNTAVNWTSSNPVLLSGEAGIETDNIRHMKLGDGATHWNDSAYFSTIPTIADYGNNLSTCSTAIGTSTKETMIIDSTINVPDNIDLTAYGNINWMFIGDGNFTITAGKIVTLPFPSVIIAPPGKQIFFGTVVFASDNGIRHAAWDGSGVNEVGLNITPSTGADLTLNTIKLGSGATISSFSAPVTFQSLIGSSAGSAKTASWTIEQIIVGSALSGGTHYSGASLSLSFNGATTGANGMDTGGTPTSGSLDIYAIYNPTTDTWACLGTTASGGAMVYAGSYMPSGYTASCLICSVNTDGGGYLLEFNQVNRTILMLPGAVVSGGTGTTWTQVSLAVVVPPNTKLTSGSVQNTGSAGIVYLAPTGSSGTTNQPGQMIITLPVSSYTSFSSLSVMSSQKLSYYITTATVNIYVSSYEF